MKWLIFIFSLLLTQLLWADQVKLELNPPKPVVGEIFQVNFKISTDSSSEPEITFNSSRFEVTGKSNQGISTRTIYANGKLSISREIIISYDLVASKAGTDFLRDIKVILDGKTLTHPSVAVTVLKEPEEIPDIFVMADVPKKELYVGEGIIVRYFLYSKGPVNAVDIKKYPKLDHFLKRFLQEPDRTERVSVDGEVYLRSQIYAAKLFPEKVGEFKIDPISLTATYPQGRGNDPFGVFGLSRNYRTKNLSSETVKIIAKPVPSPVPEGFTGLVGKHDAQIQFGKSKLIVNEPLEIKLTVTGVGALENLDPPQIFKSDAFEEFESNGDLKISGSDEATKTFDYTFLAKENVTIPSTVKDFYYFDPEMQSYQAIKLEIPEVQVAGGAVSAVENENREAEKQNGSSEEIKNDTFLKITPPDFKLISEESFLGTLLQKINLILIFGFFFAVFIFLLIKQLPKLMIQKEKIPLQFRKGHFSLTEFLKWISPLVEYFGKSPRLILEASDLDQEAQSYFIKILEDFQENSFSNEKNQYKFTYNSKHFKKLQEYIEKIKNENHK